MINRIIASILVLTIGAIAIIVAVAYAVIPKISSQTYTFTALTVTAGLVLLILACAIASISLVLYATEGCILFGPFISIRKFALEDEGINCLAYLERISLAHIANLSADDLALLPKLKYFKNVIDKIIIDDNYGAETIRLNIEQIHDIFVKFGFPSSKKELRKFYGTNPLEFTQAIDELYNIFKSRKGEGLSYIYNVSRLMIQ